MEKEHVVLSRSEDGKEVKTEERVLHGTQPVAFRCKACGHLHLAEHAGESVHPHACCVCNAGVSFNPKTGIKSFHADNWEVLADAPDARLKELGLTKANVVAHQGSAAPAQGKQLAVHANEGNGVKDKA